MRTKALLGLAALAASAFVASAQTPVYSLNVVGYVNKSFQLGYFTLVCNPLNTTNNTLKGIIPNPPDNTQVYRWSVASQDLEPVIPTYVAATSSWVPNPVINPGEGFFVAAAADFTNTFVGEVLQGNLTNAISGNYNFQAVASMVPVGGPLSSVLTGYPALDNDQVYTWNVAAQDFDPGIPTYIAATTTWSPNPNINVGDGFFLVRAGAPVNWVRNFTIP